MPPGFKPPQHCASPGEPGLLTILLARSGTRTPPLRAVRDAFQETFLLQQYNEKGRRLLPLRPRSGSNHRSRQIVPQHQAQLSERHTAALLQWQPFAAILEWSRCEVSPRYVARFIPTTCGGFLFPATNSSLPPGFKPPQHCASPGKPGLPTILRRPSDFSTRLDCVIRGAFHSLRLVFICQPYQQLQAGGVIVVLGRNLRIGLRFAKG